MKSKIKNKIGILGYGEIGKAIARFYSNPLIKDLKRDDGLAGVDILHVCIPFTNTFVRTVSKEISAIQPRLTIIHSTVVPGTTEALARKTKRMIVHSPVRGIHPELYRGIKTFVKYIGADDTKAGLMVKKHFSSLGIKSVLISRSAATEIGKLLDTTYYGLCIAWHGEMKKLTDAFSVSFDDAVINFNRTYNEGYAKLGKKNVIRPVLYPPKSGIGGHCIIPNAKLLQKYLKSKALDLLLDYQSPQ